MNRSEFIHKYKYSAMDSVAGTNLLPSVMLAQAAIESNNGNSVLSSEYNNHFGVKASKDWTGDVVNMSTREVFGGNETNITDGFRVYATALQSFIDRNKFLKENPRYASVFEAKDYIEQANALQSAGYATDPNYASTLISVIESNGLQSLDIKQTVMKTLDIISTAAIIIVAAIMVYKLILKS